MNTVLPRKPLLSSFTARLRSKVPKIHFASNPCRIKFCDQEIVVFREDLMSRMLRNLVRVKPGVSNDDLRLYVRLHGWRRVQGPTDVFILHSLCKPSLTKAISCLSSTLCNLCWLISTTHCGYIPPPPRCAVTRLRPWATLIHLTLLAQIVLADKYERYSATYEKCHVFNPGRFIGSSFNFSAYIPAQRESEEWCVAVPTFCSPSLTAISYSVLDMDGYD